MITAEDLTYAPEDVVRVFDAGPELGDRYTVFFEGSDTLCLAMGITPLAPNGFCMHVEADINIMEQKDAEVEYTDLPTDCQTAIMNELCSFYTCAPCGGYLDWSVLQDGLELIIGDAPGKIVHANCPTTATS